MSNGHSNGYTPGTFGIGCLKRSSGYERGTRRFPEEQRQPRAIETRPRPSATPPSRHLSQVSPPLRPGAMLLTAFEENPGIYQGHMYRCICFTTSVKNRLATSSRVSDCDIKQGPGATDQLGSQECCLLLAHRNAGHVSNTQNMLLNERQQQQNKTCTYKGICKREHTFAIC